MSEIPTYYAGETAKGSITFTDFVETPIEDVIVFFGYEGTNTGIGLAADELLPGTEGDNTRVAVFEIAIEAKDKPGLYQCTNLYVEYEGGRIRPIEPLPDVTFRIEEAASASDVQNPRPTSGWLWHD